LYVVKVSQKRTAHAQEGVDGVAFFITTDEQPQKMVMQNATTKYRRSLAHKPSKILSIA